MSLWLHAHGHPWIDTLMYWVTQLGAFAALGLFTFILSIFFFLRCRDLRAFFAMCLALLLSRVLNALLKNVFQRERPWLWEGALHPNGYSFPSGHAMASAAVYGVGAILFVSMFPKHRRVIYCTMGTIVFLIGLSRIYLGAHWTSDVIVGFAAGTCLSIPIGYWYRHGNHPQTP